MQHRHLPGRNDRGPGHVLRHPCERRRRHVDGAQAVPGVPGVAREIGERAHGDQGHTTRQENDRQQGSGLCRTASGGPGNISANGLVIPAEVDARRTVRFPGVRQVRHHSDHEKTGGGFLEERRYLSDER